MLNPEWLSLALTAIGGFGLFVYNALQKEVKRREERDREVSERLNALIKAGDTRDTELIARCEERISVLQEKLELSRAENVQLKLQLMEVYQYGMKAVRRFTYRQRLNEVQKIGIPPENKVYILREDIEGWESAQQSEAIKFLENYKKLMPNKR